MSETERINMMQTPKDPGAPLLRRIDPDDVERHRRPPVDAATLGEAQGIIDAVRDGGLMAVRGYAQRFGERTNDQPLLLGRNAMERSLAALGSPERSALERAAERIERFARAQRAAITPMTIAVPGGQAGHTIEPIGSAGCYGPAGRYPLPSSVLMTAITARVAGCGRVVVATPGASQAMLAAAAVAGADEVLAIGGAHAIGAMAYGFDGFTPVDVIAGPGNRWVTAAKQLVSGVVGIDMLAGPSELLVLADETADAELIAPDLLAQAEHDADASVILVTTSQSLPERVECILRRRIKTMATRDTALTGLGNGFAIVCSTMEQAIERVNAIAPEHLEIFARDAESIAGRIRNAGAVFIGGDAAEVLGDYGAGPNHTLPTAGTARFQAGLSVMHFLRLRTWLRIDDPIAASAMLHDTIRLAEMEGLSGHAESARLRLRQREEHSR